MFRSLTVIIISRCYDADTIDDAVVDDDDDDDGVGDDDDDTSDKVRIG